MAGSISLTWIASADPSVTRYYVAWDPDQSHLGATSTAYPNVVDAGSATEYVISDLVEGHVYYVGVSSAGAGGHDQYESIVVEGQFQAIAGIGLYGAAAVSSSASGALNVSSSAGLAGNAAASSVASGGLSVALAPWPFAPLVGMTESLEWLTDVIQTKTSEQRIALRRAPRRALAMAHVMGGEQYSAAQEIIRGPVRRLVPDWAHAVPIAAIDHGSAVNIPCAAACLDFRVSDDVLVWRRSAALEVVSVSAVASDSITVSQVVGTWRDVMLMPLRAGFAPAGLSVDRLTSLWSSVQVEWRIDDAADHSAAGAYPQYRGHDVMTDCPKLVGGLQEGISWALETADSGLGRVVPLRERSMPDMVCTMRWRTFSACQAKPLRQWLYSRRGRQKGFWMSSRGRDFRLVADISALATSITVAQPPGVLMLTRPGLDLEVVSLAGAVVRARVVGVGTSGGNIVLSLSAAFGTSMPISLVRRVSMLRCVRFDADRIDLVHRGRGVVEVAVRCVEVAVP